MNFLSVFFFFLSWFASWLCLRSLIPYLRKQFLDHPNARSSHALPTPRGGGLSFVLISYLSSLVSLFFNTAVEPFLLPFLLIPLVFVGILDDRFGLPSALRYLAQFLCACLMLLCSSLFSSLLSANIFPVFLLICVICLLIAITAIINFTNFMDGVDGLVSGCMAIAMSCLAIHLSFGWPIWALVGANVGFLMWNWSPARVFMGDVGSTFLGAVFAGLLLRVTSWSEAFVLLLLIAPLLGDAFFCVLRRLLDGQQVFQAHRLHLFQRLNQAGWSHARVSITYMFFTSLLGISLLIGGLSWLLGLAIFILLVGWLLDRFIAVPFAVASHS